MAAGPDACGRQQADLQGGQAVAIEAVHRRARGQQRLQRGHLPRTSGGVQGAAARVHIKGARTHGLAPLRNGRLRDTLVMTREGVVSRPANDEQ